MLFENSNKVRRGFLIYRTTINHATRAKPLRLQSLIALESTSPLRAGTFLVSYLKTRKQLSLLDKREYPKGEGVRMNTKAKFQTPPA